MQRRHPQEPAQADNGGQYELEEEVPDDRIAAAPAGGGEFRRHLLGLFRAQQIEAEHHAAHEVRALGVAPSSTGRHRDVPQRFSAAGDLSDAPLAGLPDGQGSPDDDDGQECDQEQGREGQLVDVDPWREKMLEVVLHQKSKFDILTMTPMPTQVMVTPMTSKAMPRGSPIKVAP